MPVHYTMTPRGRRLTRLLKAQGGHCAGCGKDLTHANATIDEVNPRALGGRRVIGNIVALCSPCNQAKGCRTPTQEEIALARIVEGRPLRSLP